MILIVGVCVHDFVVCQQQIALLTGLAFIVVFDLGINTPRVIDCDFVSVEAAPDSAIVVECILFRAAA